MEVISWSIEFEKKSSLIYVLIILCKAQLIIGCIFGINLIDGVISSTLKCTIMGQRVINKEQNELYPLMPCFTILVTTIISFGFYVLDSQI